LTDEQKQIIESFPEKDRGIYKQGDQNLVEEDPLEAAIKKIKIKKKSKKVQFEGEDDHS